MKLGVKKPKWTFFWCFPLIMVLGHDFFLYLNSSEGFYFSETGYLVKHFTSWEQPIIHVTENQLWRDFLGLVFNAKAALVALIWALPGVLWVNRTHRADYGPARRSFHRRKHR